MVALAVVAAAVALLAPVAEAAYPPAGNGRIVASGLATPNTTDIYTMDPDGSNLVDLTPGSPRNDATPYFSPNGRQIVFSRQVGAGSHIMLMNADGSGVRDLTPTSNQSNSSPTFTPDGRRIVFIGDANPDPAEALGTVEIMNTDGTGVRDLTPANREDEADPEVSPDGRFVAFDTATPLESLPRVVVRIPVGGGGTPNLLVGDWGLTREPAYSPDGGSLVYSGAVDPRLNVLFELFLTSATGKGRRELTSFPRAEFAENPAFSPNSRFVAYNNPFDDPDTQVSRQDVWVIRRNAPLNSGGGTPISQIPAIEPAWQYVYRCDGHRATIVGDDGRDKVKGTKRDDVIVANDGRDRINAGAGDDLVCGGSGRDVLIGGKGKDRLIGGKGKDVLRP